MPPTRKRKSLDPPKENSDKEEEAPEKLKEKEEKPNNNNNNNKEKEKEKKKKAKSTTDDSEEEKEEKVTPKKSPKTTKKAKHIPNDDDEEEEEEKPKKSTPKSSKKSTKQKEEPEEEEEVKKPKGKAKALDGIIWEWAGDAQGGSQDKWVKYSDDVANKLEEAFKKNESEYKLDKERYVDLKNMLQRRYDDPNKRRAVLRYVPDLTVTESDVAMALSTFEGLTVPDVDLILNALGQSSLPADERKKWDSEYNPNYFVYNNAFGAKKFKDALFKLAKERSSIQNILRVPRLLNPGLLKSYLEKNVGVGVKQKFISDIADLNDYEHSKLATFYNSPSAIYVRDFGKDVLDSKGNVQGAEYDLGKDDRFCNFVALIAINPLHPNIEDNLVHILKNKGFHIIIAENELYFQYYLQYADIAFVLCPIAMATSTELENFHNKGGGIAIFATNNHFSLNMFLSKHGMSLVGNDYGLGILTVGDGTSAGHFEKCLPTAGLNSLFAGENHPWIQVNSNLFASRTVATNSQGHAIIRTCDGPNGRIFVDTDHSKLTNNWNLAGVERLVGNVAIWLLGLDAKLRMGKKLYGRLTFNHFPTIPPPMVLPVAPTHTTLQSPFTATFSAMPTMPQLPTMPTMSSAMHTLKTLPTMPTSYPPLPLLSYPPSFLQSPLQLPPHQQFQQFHPMYQQQQQQQNNTLSWPTPPSSSNNNFNF